MTFQKRPFQINQEPCPERKPRANKYVAWTKTRRCIHNGRTHAHDVSPSWTPIPLETMRAHRNVERRLNRERLVPVLSASTLSSDFIPYPLVSSPFLANNCSSSSPRLLEAEPDFRFGTLPRVSSLSLFFPFSLVSRFDYERSKEDIQESEDRYR